MKQITLLGLALAFAAILLPFPACKVGPSPSPTQTVGAQATNTDKVEWVYSQPAKIRLARTETTVAQYRACVEAGKCTNPKYRRDNQYCNWGYGDRDSHPINCVDWNQATAFCAWAGGRLPTEKEWFAEASNGGRRQYPWGNSEVTCDYAVWGAGMDDGCGKNSTWPVCSKTAGNSVSGLCDMIGNVREWTSDWYNSRKDVRVVRGGSWDGSTAYSLLASSIHGHDPTFGDASLGFRCGSSAQ